MKKTTQNPNRCGLSKTMRKPLWTLTSPPEKPRRPVRIVDDTNPKCRRSEFNTQEDIIHWIR